MANGDRVVVGKNISQGIHGFDPKIKVPVYEIEHRDGVAVLDDKGCAMARMIGGANGGSLGTIEGMAVPAHRSTIREASVGHAPSSGGLDAVHLIPVRFDHYQKVAYVYSQNLKVTG
jgi:hypothetical protein